MNNQNFYSKRETISVPLKAPSLLAPLCLEPVPEPVPKNDPTSMQNPYYLAEKYLVFATVLNRPLNFKKDLQTGSNC